VTSAIGNDAPADPVVRYLESAVKHNRVVARCGPITLRETVTDMFRAEKAAGHSKSSKFWNRMNVCELGVARSASGILELRFALSVINAKQDGICATLRQVIPPLLTQAQAREADTYEMDDIKPRKPRCGACGVLCRPP